MNVTNSVICQCNRKQRVNKNRVNVNYLKFKNFSIAVKCVRVHGGITVWSNINTIIISKEIRQYVSNGV